MQIFGGVTALGTREVIRQMRGLRDVGVHGALVGLPLWQTPTLENAIGFFADLSAAVPDMAMMVYSNSWYFKFDFPLEFWRGLADRAPTVVAAKVTHGFRNYRDEVDAVGDPDQHDARRPGDLHCLGPHRQRRQCGLVHAGGSWDPNRWLPCWRPYGPATLSG